MRCIGHGGASALAPANTLRSLRLAAELGAEAVEFDVRLSRGRLIVAHTVLDGSRRCPALGDVVRWAAEEAPAHVGLVADLKTPGAELAAHRALDARGLLERTTFTSQCRSILDTLRREDPQARLAISVAGVVSRRVQRWTGWRAEVVQALRDGRYDGLMLHRGLVDERIVADVHAARATVDAWTVRDAANAVRLAALGVDGVVVTDPRIVHRPEHDRASRLRANGQRRAPRTSAAPAAPAATVAAAMPASAAARARLTDAGASGRCS
jgi:glycerophosphoryl diester phosphodiesterase